MEVIRLGWKRRLDGSDTPGLEGKTGMEVIRLGWKGRDGRGLDGSRMPVCEGRIGEDSLLPLWL